MERAHSYGRGSSYDVKRVGKGGFIEGYNFDSVRSYYETTAYNKQQELVHAAILAIAQSGSSGFNDDPLTANKIKQLKRVLGGPEIVRAEVRGKKMRGLPLWKLSQQTNRFARFHFADLSASGASLEPLIEKSFLAMCRQDSVKAAMEAFKHTEHARKVHAFWRSHQAAWWKPEQLWQQACDALGDTGMFPPEAFDEPDSHAEKQPVKRRRAR